MAAIEKSLHFIKTGSVSKFERKTRTRSGFTFSKALFGFVLTGCAFFSIGATAQESTTAAGGEASGSGGSASYSVGQMVYTTHSGSTGSMAQGVQQPYEISVVLGNEEPIWLNLGISAYPNPTTDYLILEIGDYATDRLGYQLFDLHGRLLADQKIENKETTIPMAQLSAATYFLKITTHNNKVAVKTFKIIKN